MEQSELKEILEQHKLWIESEGEQGALARLLNKNLTGADLRDADLRNIILMGADLTGADLTGADLTKAELRNANLNCVNLTGANLSGADLHNAYLHGTIGLPHISWIIPGCLAQMNRIRYNGIWLIKEIKWDNFVQDSFGFFIQDNLEEKTFDMLLGDRIIRGIPDWVKYSGLKQVATV
jgi:hypothetical protein